MKNDSLKRTVNAALFAALTFVATFVITLPTPTMGFVHLGDAFVLLSGIALGPVWGGLAAGIGSMLADLVLGYTISAVPSFAIKFSTAVTAYYVVRHSKNASILKRFLLCLLSESTMVVGYFIYHMLKSLILNMNFSPEGFHVALVYSVTGFPGDLLQAVAGAFCAALLLPLINRLSKQ